jgi:hypothetical protein
LPVIVAFQALLADKQRYYVDAGVVAILLLQPQRGVKFVVAESDDIRHLAGDEYH